MAESTKPPLSKDTNGKSAVAQRSPTAKAKPIPLNKQPKYALPLPVRTFPLPTFYPSNPVSLFHLAFAWLGQVLSPPPAEPAVVHTGVWSPETRSVHVTDPKSMNDLWCQGFYGKGSLSRSEPSWLTREKARRGSLGETSEQRTTKRREARADEKWERGRTELEAIEQRRREEAEAAEQKRPENGPGQSPDGPHLPDPLLSIPPPKVEDTPDRFVPRYQFKPPVGPLELLALPNSEAELLKVNVKNETEVVEEGNGSAAELRTDQSRIDGSTTSVPAPSLKSSDGSGALTLQDMIINGIPDQHTNGSIVKGGTNTRGSNKSYGELNGNGDANTTTIQPLKRQKSVRFSPTVESTTFQHSDPPSPNHSSLALSPKGSPKGRQLNGKAESGTARANSTAATEPAIANKEHLQLSAEEAFFLAYALGALTVLDPATKAPITTRQLFLLFRQHSYFPPRVSGTPDTLFMDDPFLVHYAVYHHFRSLGWVPRHGIKFGVDWMLYGKGPALDHAEFGVIVLPSYTDPWWKQQGKQPARRSWHWLHSSNRVLSTVFKSLVLVYVDVPPPVGVNGKGDDENVTSLLGRFKIREVMLKRWSSNRNRD